jgi:hypothetical protein
MPLAPPVIKIVLPVSVIFIEGLIYQLFYNFGLSSCARRSIRVRYDSIWA